MDTWEQIPGQRDVAQRLQRAALAPVHAYLLVGLPGAGVESVARAFAAELVARDDASVERVLRSRHPDVIEVEPEGVSYRIKEDVRERIIAEANRSPIESDRKVIIVYEAERLRADSANALLKTLEEPPARTILMLCAGAPDDLLPTIRSRCQRVDLAPLDETMLRAALIAHGRSDADATLGARLSGGRIDRALALTGVYAPLRATWITAAARLDGTLSAAMRAAADAQHAIAEATERVEAEQAQAVEELESELERSGYSDRVASGMRTRLRKANERSLRRAKQEAVIEGITALESMYRDSLLDGEHARNLDRDALRVNARDAGNALDACSTARHSLKRNPNEALLLERLFAHLPAVSAR